MKSRLKHSVEYGTVTLHRNAVNVDIVIFKKYAAPSTVPAEIIALHRQGALEKVQPACNVM